MKTPTKPNRELTPDATEFPWRLSWWLVMFISVLMMTTISSFLCYQKETQVCGGEREVRKQIAEQSRRKLQ